MRSFGNNENNYQDPKTAGKRVGNPLLLNSFLSFLLRGESLLPPGKLVD